MSIKKIIEENLAEIYLVTFVLIFGLVITTPLNAAILSFFAAICYETFSLIKAVKAIQKKRNLEAK